MPNRQPVTENPNPRTVGLDLWPVKDILETMSAEDHGVAPAVAREIPNVEKAVALAVNALSREGRIFYAGAGTSGCIGALDARELLPTFGDMGRRVIPLLAGGADAIFHPEESAEDSRESGERALSAHNPGPKDLVIGIAASGRTPFVLGCLQTARSCGTPTVALTGHAGGEIARLADVVIAPQVGPEIIAGSTRLKNGSAQKLVLNMISTATMVSLGRTYSNLMAGTSPRNTKLTGRALQILTSATGKPLPEARETLARSEGNLDLALVSLAAGVTIQEASGALARCQGAIRKAVNDASGLSNEETRLQSGPASRLPPYLKPGSPQEAGLDPARTERAFSVVENAVGDGCGMIPGAVAAIVRHGVLVGPRAYGWAVREPVQIRTAPDTIFDLASLTKVTATAPLVLLLCQRGFLRLDDTVATFIPEFAGGGKEGITVRHLLTHTSGLPAHIRFWEMGLRGKEIIDCICSMSPEGTGPGEKVVYSDLGFLILGELVERITGTNLERFASTEVFTPLGMKDTCFRPDKSLQYRLAATEFRKDLGKIMWGEVHDENALAMGGIAGHAGLFSTAKDLAQYVSMWLGHGKLGETRILSPAIATLATHEHTFSGQRRGLGWKLRSRTFSSGGDLMSEKAYGHTGFTGTSIWCDPETSIAVILLTNRVHAGRENNATIRLRPLFANAAVSAIEDSATTQGNP